MLRCENCGKFAKAAANGPAHPSETGALCAGCYEWAGIIEHEARAAQRRADLEVLRRMSVNDKGCRVCGLPPSVGCAPGCWVRAAIEAISGEEK